MDKNADVFSPRGENLIYLAFYDKLFVTYNRSGLATVWRLECRNYIYVKLAFENVILSCVDYQEQGHGEQGRVPAKEDFAPPPSPSKGGPVKNLHTKSERLTFSCRVNCVWSERVDLYNRLLSTTTKKYAT